MEERAERQAIRLAKHDATLKRIGDRQQQRDEAMDLQVAEGVRTGLDVVRAVITAGVFLWIAFLMLIAIVVVPDAGSGALIPFGLLIVPAMLYAKRSVRLLMQKDRRTSVVQSVVHDAIIAKQESLDVEQGFSRPSSFS